jgi:hypothetical protein
LKVIAAVARGTNWPLRKVEEEEEEDEQVVEHASPISKCFSTVPVGQQQEEVAEVPSSYRISRRTRSVVSVSLVGSPVPTRGGRGISLFFMSRFQLRKARVFFSFFLLYRGRGAFIFGRRFFRGRCRCPSTSSVL